MTIVSALKALAKKVTGQDIGGETVDEALESFATKYTTGGGNLPAVDSGDNGDVLTVSGGVWTNAAPVAELPAVTADDNGDVLTVADGAWTKGTIPTELPAVSSDDNGKILKVVEGVWAAVLPEA